MPRIREERPSTFTEIVEIIEGLKQPGDGTLWYRGCGRSDHKLLPSLFRHSKAMDIKECAGLEQSIITRFRQRSIPFHDRNLSDEWDNLFFMQHYGVPTRLLDWTENPFVGLYFATMSAPHKITTRGNIRFESAAALWVLDPVKWNRHSLKHQSFEGGVLAPGDDALKGYRPAPSYAGMNNHPVALYGAHNSPRIVAQRGTFTIFGQNNKAMERAFVAEGYPADTLIKIVLSRQALPNIRRSILEHGTTESVVFPDLVGLANEIKRVFHFEVPRP